MGEGGREEERERECRVCVSVCARAHALVEVFSFRTCAVV